MYLLLAVIIVVSSAVYYCVNPGSSNEYFSGTALMNDRFRGWFVNPNDLATLYGVFFLPILGFEIMRQRSGLVRLALLVVLVLAAIQLLATQSRAGIAAGLIALVVLYTGDLQWRSRILVLAVMVLLMTTIYFQNPQDNLVRDFAYRNEATLEGSGRLAYWASAWGRFLQRPILGAGMGVSDTGARVAVLAYSSEGYTLQKDNSYIAALEENGLVGCAILVTVLLLPLIRSCWKWFRASDRQQRRARLVFVAIVAAGLFNALFESWLLAVGNLFCLSFWTFAALLVADDGVPPMH
jgi:O-antigen ligase